MTYIGTHRALRKRTIVTGSATTLAFVSDFPAGQNYTSTLPAITVAFVNSNCQVIGSQTGTLTLTVGTNPGSATTSGSLTYTNVIGAQTFQVNLTGTNISGANYVYRISAAGYAVALSSTPFSIISPLLSAVSIKITQEPTTHSVHWFVSPAMSIALVNSNCAVVNSENANVTISFGAGGPVSASFDQGSVTTVATVNGTATFSAIRLGGPNITGTGYTYRFSATGFTAQVTSTAFTIERQKIAYMTFITHPSNTTVGSAIPNFSVGLFDVLDQGNASASSSFTVTLLPQGTTAVLSGPVSQTQIDIDNPLSIDTLTINASGTFQLVVSYPGISSTSIISNQFTVT